MAGKIHVGVYNNKGKEEADLGIVPMYRTKGNALQRFFRLETSL
jgi:hypothetical protein